MRRARIIKTAAALAENAIIIDENIELSTASQVGKRKSSRAKKTEKPEEILTNGNGLPKGRAPKKPKSDDNIEIQSATEKSASKIAKTSKFVSKGLEKKKDKAPVKDGDIAETFKAKKGRTKKATEEDAMENTQDEVGKPEADPPKTKSVRASKRTQKEENVVEAAKVEPSTSAAAKGRKIKEKIAEPSKNVEKSKAVGKKTVTRGKKRTADEAIEEVPAVTSKLVEKETVTASKKRNTKITDQKVANKEVNVKEKSAAAEKPAKSTAAARKRGVPKAAKEGDEEPAGSKPKKALLNPTETTYNKADFELTDVDKNLSNVSNSGVERKLLKISSWNVAGLRSWLKKDGLKFLEYEDPDIFCMQETKVTVDQMPEEAQRIPGYHPYWLCLPGGYAGVALYSKIMPINVEYGIGNAEFDDAGRLITAEYEKFFLVNVYVPNSGRKLVNLEARMLWEKLFQAFVKKLDARKPVIICGDMNVAHTEIDLANPKSNLRSAGFTIEEREKMSELLSLGFLDTFREINPTKIKAYTYWTYMANARAKNVGWRLDYFLVSERIGKRVIENAIRSQVLGSDHCPITLFINI